MNINVEVIAHNQQRYNTIGDWWFDNTGTLQIRVSSLGNHFYESLVAIHEQWEAILCLRRRIPEAKVTAFDEMFEKNRPHGNDDEPGDHPDAPYHREHCSATGVERLLCSELEYPWAHYCDEIDEATKPKD